MGNSFEKMTATHHHTSRDPSFRYVEQAILRDGLSG